MGGGGDKYFLLDFRSVNEMGSWIPWGEDVDEMSGITFAKSSLDMDVGQFDYISHTDTVFFLGAKSANTN